MFVICSYRISPPLASNIDAGAASDTTTTSLSAEHAPALNHTEQRPNADKNPDADGRGTTIRALPRKSAFICVRTLTFTIPPTNAYPSVNPFTLTQRVSSRLPPQNPP
jgi:hypothetical protein